MRKIIVAITTVFAATLALASPVAAFVGGGRKPSEAPLITPGQRYTGELNNHKSDANHSYAGGSEVAFWRLPPLETHDLIVVSWHELPFAHDSHFPVCMILAQNVNDYNWGSVFGEVEEDNSCNEDGPIYGVSGSGTAQTNITVPEANSTSSFLEFRSFADEETSSEFESYPYDFTVSGPLHYLSAAISPTEHVRVNGTISASVMKADGSPAPDGLTFTLNVSKDGEGIATYTAATSGGALGFQLSLPEALVKEDAEFVVSRAADSTYQSVESAKLEAQLARAQAPPPSPCPKARAHAHSLARQLNRLKRHARFARGKARRRLHRRAHRVARHLKVARRQAAALCGAA